MGLFGFFGGKEAILGIDIGSTGIKLVQYSLSAEKPKLVTLAYESLPQDVFNNYTVSKPEIVSEHLGKIIDANKIETKLVSTLVPGPSVFTKRIKMPKLSREELAMNIHLEAANFIPHNIDAVKLDFHVLGDSGKNQVDILVAAVKTEIIESIIESLLGAGLETAIVDVEPFALQNAFETSYPTEFANKNVALVNVGARYAAVNICRNGLCLFSGDVATGGKNATEGLATELGVSLREAEDLKRKGSEETKSTIKKQVDQMSNELNRQLSFFWNASGAEDGIDQIFLSGGGILPGMVEALAAKTGISTTVFDPFRGVDIDSTIDPLVLKKYAPFMAVASGLALRQPGDKIFPDDM